MHNSEEFIIDGSHYGSILKAIEYVLYSSYKAIDTEIVWNVEKELYTLRTIEEEPVIIATIPG